MRLQPSPRRHLPTLLLLGFCLLLLTIPAAAQGDPPAPQFLYRDENTLVLLNGYTGEATELPIKVTERDRFEWSPDGQYLLAQLQDTGVIYGYCLNLYDVDARAWLYNEPISCAVVDALFSSDSRHIAYASNTEDGNNASLSLYSLADETSQELYRTTTGDELRPAGISDIQLSPTETYATFVTAHTILGGSRNYFEVMNIDSHNHFTVSAPNQYYASYHPIWSDNDRWFLIVLQEEYVTSGTLPSTNHRGDVYLINSESGEEYRITYTPAIGEGDVRWTDDGKIAFNVTVVERQNFTFTPEQAMKVEEIPSDEIVWPEPIDAEDYYGDPLANVMVSPDTWLGAWVSYPSTQGETSTRQLNIGHYLSIERTVIFSVSIPESYSYSNILIGWRPSDYRYPQG